MHAVAVKAQEQSVLHAGSVGKCRDEGRGTNRLACKKDTPSKICRHHFFTTLRFTRLALWMYLHTVRDQKQPISNARRARARTQAAHRAPSLFERARSHNLRDEDYLLGTWQVEVGQKSENVLTGKGDDANMRGRAVYWLRDSTAQKMVKPCASMT